jgi:hypothetical protein
MRKLTLRKESLAALTSDELADVVGALNTTPCPTPPVTNLLKCLSVTC